MACPLATACAPLIQFTQNSYSEHHVTTRQQTIMEKGITTFKHNWNDRRSRRVFLCFYSAIFQLTSAKFQTLLITRERLGLASLNFDSSLRLMSCMFVPNFEAIGHVTLVLGPENRPASLA